MRGLRKALPKGFVNNWIRPDQARGKVNWFDLPEKIQKKTKVAHSYPGLSPWMTPTKRDIPAITKKEMKLLRSIAHAIRKQAGVSIWNDFSLFDRSVALVQSLRWEYKRRK